jgi:predicted signal transduction protein with EAL and GGDEF domain
MGDELLKQVAGRLRMVCERPGVFLARVGGDEFVCLLPEVSAELAQAFAQSLVQVLTDPYEFEGCYQHTIGASVGIALLPDHGSTAEEIMARADIALYSAKEAGKGTVHLFEFDMEHQVQGHVRLESELRESLENGEGLFVFYQPIVDAKTQKITTREALVRWHHKTEGWISPSKFVPIAEVRALIDKLGAFVLSRACHDAAGWSDGVSVAVNVSAVQLGKGLLMPVIQATLAESGLAPQRLEIEVTETALMRDEGKVVDELHQIRKLGVRVALDDFGTGYSSLSHLQAFPFDKIKIDGSFVQTLGKQSNSVTLVRAIAKIGRELGITTVAEGVETLDQLACVCAAGCTEFQGFLFGLPMPSERDAAEVAALDYNGLVKTEPSRASRRVFG